MSRHRMTDALRVCRCGHTREPHEHYSRTTRCSDCPAGGCDRWRPRYWWHRRRA